MAGGGDVKAGIPNYPDVNVTRGFLPAALGFKNAGDTTEKKGWYDALVTVIAGYLGKEKSQDEIEEVAADLINKDPDKAEEIVNQAIEEGVIPPETLEDWSGTWVDEYQKKQDAAKFQGSEQGKAIADAFNYAGQGSGQSTGAPTVTPTETVTEYHSQPGGKIEEIPFDPKSIIEGLRKNTIPGGYHGAPSATSQTTPGIGPRLETSPGESSGAPQDTGGITEIKPEKANMFDINEDGVVDMKDLEALKEKGIGKDSWLYKKLLGMLGIVEDWSPDEPEKKKEVVPDVPEYHSLPGGKIDVTESPETIDKEKIKIKRKPEKDVITKLPPISAEQEQREDEDKWTGIGPDEQKLLKLLAAERAKNTGQPDSGGITDKKDVPAWALPMMSAGFAMMASKSPYFMQALGEGGQKGLETYAAQKTAEEEKLDKESERKWREAQAKYYETRTQKPDIKVMTDDEGRGVYYRWDDTKKDYVSLNRIAVPSNADITKELETSHTAQMWATYTTEKKQQLIKERRNEYLGIVQSNISTVEEKGGSIMDKIKKLEEIIESWNPDKKDGGIVTLRR